MMKLQGFVGTKPVLILIDGGASHNFIAEGLVQKLGLRVGHTPSYGVRLGDGYKRVSQGCCKDLRIQIAEHTTTGDFYLFELGGVDIVLGAAWLVTLGEVKVNWRTLSMSFMHQGQIVEVKGDPSLVQALISPKALQKVSEVELASILWVFTARVEERELQDKNTEISSQQKSKLQQLFLLRYFEDCFSISLYYYLLLQICTFM